MNAVSQAVEVGSCALICGIGAAIMARRDLDFALQGLGLTAEDGQLNRGQSVDGAGALLLSCTNRAEGNAALAHLAMAGVRAVGVLVKIVLVEIVLVTAKLVKIDVVKVEARQQ